MGRFIAAIIAATAIVFIAITAPMRIGAFAAHSPWQSLAPGVEYRRWQPRTAGGEEIVAHLVRVDLKQARLRVLTADQIGHRRATAQQFAEATGALAVINGGFFDRQSNSLGLLISDGEEKSRWLSREWGIFMIRGGAARIIHARDYQPSLRITQALEVGPRLVVGGRTMRLKEQIARRSAIGVLSDGRVLLFACTKSLSLAELATLFASRESAAGLGCTEALHLDSGQSTQLHVPRAAVRVRGGTPVTSAIGIFAHALRSR